MTVSPGQSITYYPGYVQQSVNQTPLLQQIASITQANPCVITTSNSHGYNLGAKLSFRIPFIFGMSQLNSLTAQILSVTSNTITIAIDSTQFTPFAYPSPLPNAYSLPYTVPIGGAGPIPAPIPDPNQDSFAGVVYNNGFN
jgi:hypothetical protein